MSIEPLFLKLAQAAHKILLLNKNMECQTTGGIICIINLLVIIIDSIWLKLAQFEQLMTLTAAKLLHSVGNALKVIDINIIIINNTDILLVFN